MMLTIAQLQTIMIDTSLSASTVTSDLAQACIDDAEGEIKSALSNRYDVSSVYFNTSTSIPPVIRKICRWIAAGHAYTHLSRGGKDALKRAEHYLKMGGDALTAIIDRTVDLTDTLGSTIPEADGSFSINSNTKDYSHTFNEDDPRLWAVDQDKLDDIDDERKA
jgi:phage gp36-like protein